MSRHIEGGAAGADAMRTGPSADWDARGLALAAHVGSWSKDPSTQTGCAIFRPDRTVASVGYNGFPRGVHDTAERLNDRPTKYAMVVHAEANAVVLAGESLSGCTAYVHPWPPCVDCAGLLIQAGIARIVAPQPTEEQVERWGASLAQANTMLEEAGVELVLAARVDSGEVLCRCADFAPWRSGSLGRQRTCRTCGFVEHA